MWSRDALPSSWNAISLPCGQSPSLVEELIHAYAALGRHVLGPHPAEELAGTRDAADDAGALAVREDGRVPRGRAPHLGHAVQRVPPLEELQVAGAQVELAE